MFSKKFLKKIVRYYYKNANLNNLILILFKKDCQIKII